MATADVKVVATNRQARRDYDVLDTVECGIVLRGSEVKSLREARVQLSDANARIIGGEMWLVGLHIQPYSHGAGHGEPLADRDRKLLLHREEINRFRARVDQDRLALVPLRLYFRDGRAKVEIALARGRRKYDKRDAIAKRDADLEARRALSRSARGAAGNDG
jgi:SsrA-binding protein